MSALVREVVAVTVGELADEAMIAQKAQVPTETCGELLVGATGDIAKGSCGEARSMDYVAEDINCVSAPVAHQRRQRAIKISRGIATLTSRFRQ